jgi:hypothetical protein
MEFWTVVQRINRPVRSGRKYRESRMLCPNPNTSLTIPGPHTRPLHGRRPQQRQSNRSPPPPNKRIHSPLCSHPLQARRPWHPRPRRLRSPRPHKQLPPRRRLRPGYRQSNRLRPRNLLESPRKRWLRRPHLTRSSPLAPRTRTRSKRSPHLRLLQTPASHSIRQEIETRA